MQKRMVSIMPVANSIHSGSPGTDQAKIDLLLRRIAWIALVLVAASAATTVCGQLMGWQILTNPIAGGEPLDLASRVAILCLSVALLFVIGVVRPNRSVGRLAQTFALIAICVGLLDTQNSVVLARVCLVLCGSSILLLQADKAWIRDLAQYVAVLICVSASIAMLAFAYSLSFVFESGYFAGIPLRAAFMFFGLAVAIFLARPDSGPASILTRQGAGGSVARWLLLPLWLQIPFLGFLSGVNLHRQIDLPVLLFVFNFAVPLGVWTVAISLNRHDEEVRCAYEQLQASEQKFRLLVEGVKDSAVVMLDPDGNVASWNAGAQRISGYSAREIVGRNYRRLVASSDFNCIEEARHKAEQVGSSALDARSVRKDGLEYWSNISFSVLKDEAGSLAGWAVVVRDTTDRELKKELERRNADLELVLYVVSHDLKEPLRAISNFSRLLTERYCDCLDAKGSDFLRRVLVGSNRMNQLLDDILLLARARRLDVPTDEIQGDSVVSTALRRLELAIKEKGARIHIDRPLPRLRADNTWAVQAVYNLVANALKFTCDDQAPEIEIGPYLTSQQVGFVVRDRGPGVKSEYTERIFQLFQRAVGRDVEGTGAGLAIVRQIAERHGGSAWVQSREGGGSEFYISFGAPP